MVKDYYITGEVQSVQYPVFIDYDDEGKNFIEGEQTFYHKNGNAMIRQQYFNNLLNGPMEGYYEDGSLAMTGFYIMGIPDGDFVSCYPNGDFQSIKKYVDGHLLNNKCLEFTEDGTPILIYKEDFDVNSQYWETRGQNGVVEVLNANSVSLQANPERQIGGGIVTGFLPMSENIISILTTQYNPGVGTVSLLFGFKDWDNFCALSINGQQYNFNYTKNGVQVMGKEWKQSDAIHPSVNVVSVANIGEKIILIINDQPVEELGRIYYDGSFCGVSLYNPSDEPILLEAAELTVQEVPQSEEQIVQYLPESKHGANGGWTSNGSGFFISSNGYIATNYHVVADSEALQANFTRNGQVESYPADIVITDPDNDLAIIKINDSKFTTVSKLPYGLLPRQKPTGSTVYAMGYPAIGDMGTDVKFTDGKISCKSGFRGDERYYQISAPIQPGNSGGPLFDTEGNVVGINSAYYKGNGFVAQNVNYAIKSPLLKTLIEKVPEICVLEENEQAIPASNQELSEQISLYEDFVVLILSRDKK